MRFREVNRKLERERVKKEEAFKKIKPKSNITLEECNEFWDNFFMNMEENEKLERERVKKEEDEK